MYGYATSLRQSRRNSCSWVWGHAPQKIVVSMDSETFFQAISQCNFQNFNQTTMFSLFSNKGQDFLLRKIIIMIQQTECR